MNRTIKVIAPSEIVIRSLNGNAHRPELPGLHSEFKRPEKVQRDDFWLKAYSHYLDHSPIWRQRSHDVILRNPICQGCLRHPSTQAHHLWYQKAWPGTDEWIKQEKLFQLIALCDQCHKDIHPKTDIQLLFDEVSRMAA